MLPKLQTPIFDIVLPSTKKKVKVRQMTVKEEKIILIARNGTSVELYKAMVQIVNNCMVDKIDVEKLPVFDIEYLFMRIRALSISNTAKVKYTDNDDNQDYSFDIDLDKVDVKFPEDVAKQIKVDALTIMLRYPPVSLYCQDDFYTSTEEEMFNRLAVSAIEKIFEDDKLHLVTDSKSSEILEFIDSLPASKYKEIQSFLSNIPTLYHELSYTNQNGKERKIILRTVDDFFTF